MWNQFPLLKKEGATVPKKRLVIDLSEILHLEIYCNECKKLSILPIEDPPETQERREGADTYLASYKCTSCLKPFGAGTRFQAAVDKIREGLESHRRAQSEFSLRLVIQK
jgi:hypothetical protein